MLKFVLIGLGYVSPRHLRAIKDCGGTLVAAMDLHDNVGFLDSYFIECRFFKDFKKFESFCRNEHPDFFVVCTPNFFHYEHCLVGLRMSADVICEKPTVLTSTDVSRLVDCEREMERNVFTILQLRLKKELLALRSKITSGHKVLLQYYTPRGPWYAESWKGNSRISGGLATNIGIHMFDMLLWLFGPEYGSLSVKTNKQTIEGSFETQKASISFDLSIDPSKSAIRRLVIDGEAINFTHGFNDLHTESYKEIISGNGFGLDIVRPSISLCEKIRALKG